MKLDLNKTISDRDGMQKTPLKLALCFLLDNFSPGSREVARQHGRLSDKIAESNGITDISDADIQLIRALLDADKGMKTWALEALEYHLWPDELADSDRERLARRYGEE